MRNTKPLLVFVFQTIFFHAIINREKSLDLLYRLVPMAPKKTKNWTRMVAFLLSLLTFLCLVPSSLKDWYQAGRGYSYEKALIRAGLTHQQSSISSSHERRLKEAKINGVVYALLMLNGLYLPLLFCSLLTVILVTTPLSSLVNYRLLILFPVFFLWGIFFFGLALVLVSATSFLNSLLEASIVWMGIIPLCGLILLGGLSMRVIMSKMYRLK